MLNYCQKLLGSCCFSGLASDYSIIGKTKAANDISFRIEGSLKNKIGNHIDIANAILKTKHN